MGWKRLLHVLDIQSTECTIRRLLTCDGTALYMLIHTEFSFLFPEKVATTAYEVLLKLRVSQATTRIHKSFFESSSNPVHICDTCQSKSYKDVGDRLFVWSLSNEE